MPTSPPPSETKAAPLRALSHRPLSRRGFCFAAPFVPGWLVGQGATGVHFPVADFDRPQILSAADSMLTQPPLSITSTISPDIRLSSHLFYSEKIRRADNEDDEDNEITSQPPFAAHLELLTQMNERVSAFTAAWRCTQKESYLQAALQQIRVWFLNAATRMEPTLQYTGMAAPRKDDERENGVSETTCLAETARSLSFLLTAPQVTQDEAASLRLWFSEILSWLNESKKGTIARDSKDLQAICWSIQAAEFAEFTHNDTLLQECKRRFREKLLRLMNLDGAFPAALQTNRPYAISMFALECMSVLCEVLSTPFENLWRFNLPDGRGMRSAVAWAFPYLKDRGKWPYLADARYFHKEPVRQNALLFAGRAYNNLEYTELWKGLRPASSIAELRREHPVTQPSLWTTRLPA